jgi:hypothetical protein
MRLVITKCHRCNRVTGAKHADTLEELEIIGTFIREAKRLHQDPQLIEYGHSDSTLSWCSCNDSVSESFSNYSASA